MKLFTLALLSMIGFPCAVAAQTLSKDLASLKQQYEAQSLAALKPIVLHYAAQLQELRRAAAQRNQLHEALEIDELIAQLQRDTKIEIPLPIGAASSLKSDEDLTKVVSGSTWQKATDAKRRMTFREDGGVSTTWGGAGKWKVASPHHITIHWNNKTRYELEYDAANKKIVVDGKEVWMSGQ